MGLKRIIEEWRWDPITNARAKLEDAVARLAQSSPDHEATSLVEEARAELEKATNNISTSSDIEGKAAWLAGLTTTVGVLGTGLGTLQGAKHGWVGVLFYGAGVLLALSLGLVAATWITDPLKPGTKKVLLGLGAVFLFLSLLSAALSPFGGWRSDPVVLEYRFPANSEEPFSARLYGQMIEAEKRGELSITVDGRILAKVLAGPDTAGVLDVRAEVDTGEFAGKTLKVLGRLLDSDGKELETDSADLSIPAS